MKESLEAFITYQLAKESSSVSLCETKIKECKARMALLRKIAMEFKLSKDSANIEEEIKKADSASSGQYSAEIDNNGVMK